jgi:branched-chain amino acid transport system permease protein
MDLLSFDPGVWEPILIAAGYSAIVATGLYFSNSAGALSAAHAAFAGIGGYVAAVLTTNFGLPLPVALVAAMVAAALVGSLLALLTLRMDPLVASLTTLAFGEMLVVIAFNSSYLGGAQSFTGIPPLTQTWQVYLGLVLVLLVAWRFDGSRLGLAAQACRHNEGAAAASGINTPRVKVTVFAIGTAIAGLGGGFRAHYVLVQNPNDMAFWVSVNYLIFWIFGGAYSFWGPALGAIILTIVPELLRFSTEDRYIVYGALLVAFVLLRPNGIVPRFAMGSLSRWRIGFHQRPASGE